MELGAGLALVSIWCVFWVHLYEPEFVFWTIVITSILEVVNSSLQSANLSDSANLKSVNQHAVNHLFSSMLVINMILH